MSEVRRHRLPRLQFSLRFLLAIVAVVAVVVGAHLNGLREQRIVVAELGKVQSQVHYDYQTGFAQGCWRYVGPAEPPQPAWVTKLLGDDFFAKATFVIASDLPNYPVTDETLAFISRLPHLRRLEIRSNRITDLGLSYLAKLHEIEEINLISSNVTEAGLLHLHSMLNLTSLNLDYVPASNKGLDRLRRALPDCNITSHHRLTEDSHSN